jgi:hypothetical protein
MEEVIGHVHTCVLCGVEFVGWGHNPEPIAPFDSGRACTTCNDTIVIPARMDNLFGKRQEKK